jgi:hypothetical protein
VDPVHHIIDYNDYSEAMFEDAVLGYSALDDSSLDIVRWRQAGFDLNSTLPPAQAVWGAASSRRHGLDSSAPRFFQRIPVSGNHQFVEARQPGAQPELLLWFTTEPVAADGQLNCNQEVKVIGGTCRGLSVFARQLTIDLLPDKNSCVTVSLSGINGLAPTSIRYVSQEGNIDHPQWGSSGSVDLLDLMLQKAKLFTTASDPYLARFDLTGDGNINMMDLNITIGNLFQNTTCP